MKPALDASYVVEQSIQQLVKFLFLSFILALALTRVPHFPCIAAVWYTFITSTVEVII